MEKQKIEYINPKELEVDKYNVRRNDVADPELEASIQSQGIIEPLVARQVPGKSKLQIVCGGRRLRAAIAVKLKEVPFIRRNLSDLQALGLSLQENLARDNLSSFDEAEAIANMWELMNGEKNYEQKCDYIEEQFGIKRKQTDTYLSISRLSETIKEFVKKKEGQPAALIPDTQVLAEISNEDEWSDTDKKQAIEITSKIPECSKRRKMVRELRVKAKEGIKPKEAYEEIKKRPEGKTYTFYLPYEVNKPFEAWCLKNGKDCKTAVVMAIKLLIKK